MFGKNRSAFDAFRPVTVAAVLAVIASVFAALSASAQHLGSNPTFDNQLTGYTTTGFVGVYTYYGTNNALLCDTSCGYTTLATLTQAIATTPGQSYLVSFLASFYPGTYTATFGTGSFSHQGATQAIGTPYAFSFTGTATGTVTDLTFTSDGATALDNLDVEAAPAPLPGGGQLSILAALGWFAIRRRRNPATA